MKYYKDDCHHYKVLDNHRVVEVTNLGEFEVRIAYFAYLNMEHHVMDYIRDKTIKPCTKKDFYTAFAKALNTINNLK